MSNTELETNSQLCGGTESLAAKSHASFRRKDSIASGIPLLPSSPSIWILCHFLEWAPSHNLTCS
ncbi:Flavin-dependent oxidoreductase FOX2 [Senna tora]|uniref:Flavin-dependent oxidoreductase FOX2 n=1 Tax=Senna tora TaxID=362788 RepID=A0A834SMB9_9FABA|nr:Flavin-dependent oxidoreductase FOX2 [Senna tora]